MGVMEDTFGEFKKAKTPEKVVIIGASIAVLGIALYLHNKSQSQQSSQSGPATSSQSGGFPTVPQGQIPILPSGTNPLYDPNGNLVGYQNAAPPSPPTTGGPPIPPIPPSPTPTPAPNKTLPIGTRIWGKGGKWWYQEPGQQRMLLEGKGKNPFFTTPTTFLHGQNGAVWATPQGGPKYLLVPGHHGIRQQNTTPPPTQTSSHRAPPVRAGQTHVVQVMARRQPGR